MKFCIKCRSRKPEFNSVRFPAWCSDCVWESERIIMSEWDLQWFYDSVTVNLETGCWTMASTGPRYGLFHIKGCRTRMAHIIAYEHFVGRVPRGKILGHTCQSRCAFWEHVRPITYRQNTLEAYGHDIGEFHGDQERS